MRLFLVLLFVFLTVADVNSWWIVEDSNSASGGSSTYDYYGFPHLSNGSPNESGVSWTGYGSTWADRVYVRRSTASGNCTADAINIYIYNVPGANYEYACLYNNTTLVGKVDISDVSNTGWTGYRSLSVESGQSLDITSGNTLNYGFAGDNTRAVGNYLGRDANDSSSVIDYYNQSWSVNPPATVGWDGPSSSHGLGVILRCVN